MRRISIVMAAACVVALPWGRVLADAASTGTAPEGGTVVADGDTPLVAGSVTQARISVPTSLGTLRGDMGAARPSPGAWAAFSLDGHPDVLEIVATPIESALAYARMDVRFGGLGSLRYLLTPSGPAPLETDISDCAAIAELPVMRAAVEAAQVLAERLSLVTSAEDPATALLAGAWVLAASGALAPTLVDDCRDVAGRFVLWRCMDEAWEEDCKDCCERGRMVTDVGAVFCGALGALFCSPSLIGMSVCGGAAAATCKAIGDLAEKDCRNSCGPLPKKPEEGKACGGVEGAKCQDFCPGEIVDAPCGEGLVCCAPSSPSPGP